MEFNIVQILQAVAADRSAAPAIVHRDIERTWSEQWQRIARFGTALSGRGIGWRDLSAGRRDDESPHHHVALYLYNCPEYLDAMFGSSVAGAAAVNVNWRYRAGEVAHILADSDASVVVYHQSFADTLGAALDDPRVTRRPLLVVVPDDSGSPILSGSILFESLLESGSATVPGSLSDRWSADDLYICYTGGTTGAPKGVMWRQSDFLAAALGVCRADGTDFDSLGELVDHMRRPTLRALPAPPLMHGAAHWNALSCWVGGGTVVIQNQVRHFEPIDVIETVEHHEVTSLLIVGDAFGRPLVDAIDELRGRRPEAPDSNDRAMPTLRYIISGGAVLSPTTADDLLARLGDVSITDVLGSTESGRQAVATTTRQRPGGGRFDAARTATVLDPSRTRELDAGSTTVGWLAQGGRVPLGYLGDLAKTAATFVTIDGRRWAVPGDRARRRHDGSVELLGRESSCINTGGEKVFAEEVEAVLRGHPAVADALVAPVESARLGHEVGIVVQPRDGDTVTLDALRAFGAAQLASYKLPRHLVVCDTISRSPSGKPDYPWARAQLASDASAGSRPARGDGLGLEADSGRRPNPQ